MWNGIIERVSSQGIEKLSPCERTGYYVNWYLADFESGGLNGFLYNVSPEQGEDSSWSELCMIADSVEEVGGPISAEKLRNVGKHMGQANIGEIST